MKISINSIDIGYDDHGIGMPLIFLHAFPLNRTMWTGQISALLDERRFRLVAPDWRGFGESRIEGDISTMEMLADDIAALIKSLGMQSVILCGLSMGGYVAFAFLRKYPQYVGGLILADTRPGIDSEEGKANREQLALLALTQGTDAVADLQLPRLLSPETLRRAPEVGARVRQMISSATPQGIAAASRGMAHRLDATALLPQITCPTLVVAGEQDTIIFATETQQYAQAIPGAQLAFVPHAGHLSNLEQPEAFHSILRNFLLSAF